VTAIKVEQPFKRGVRVDRQRPVLVDTVEKVLTSGFAEKPRARESSGMKISIKFPI